jgi:hypothetical protein
METPGSQRGPRRPLPRPRPAAQAVARYLHSQERPVAQQQQQQVGHPAPTHGTLTCARKPHKNGLQRPRDPRVRVKIMGLIIIRTD